MGKQKLIWFFAVLVAFFGVVGCEKVPPSKGGVKSFFVYGDSTVDVGNNNYLQTIARSDHSPYGQNFDTHQATGRFSNGRLSIDYIAERLKLPFPKPYLDGVSFNEMKNQGANFASAAAGILPESGSDLGQHIPFEEQIAQMVEFHKQLKYIVGEEEARKFMEESLHYISIGSNDYIHTYFAGKSSVKDPFAFAGMLVSKVRGHLETLYSMGVRKLVVVNVGPLGCTPYIMKVAKKTECFQEANIAISIFNTMEKESVAEMTRLHPDLKITFVDLFAGLANITKNYKGYNLDVPDKPCCTGGTDQVGGALCKLTSSVCQKPDGNVWWDMFHTTEKVNKILADAAWSGDNKNLHITNGHTVEQLVST